MPTFYTGVQQTMNTDNGSMNNSNNFSVYYQARFTAAVQLSKNPTMIFNEDSLNFVPFITYMANTYKSADIIFDLPILYSILCKHLTGDAFDLVQSCNFKKSRLLQRRFKPFEETFW